jgi:GTP pyrophosphokinase
VTVPVLKSVIPGWDLDSELLARLDADLLARAYRFSEVAHHGQKRSSGEPYVAHCVQVARILAELHLDSVTVACGLIHDVVEDTAVTVADVEREFGAEMAQIVDGVTKIGSLAFQSREERQVENYRKLLLSIAKDVRVILIKLADRLHNMRTLDYLAEEKRRRIAQETMDLYAPMAHRFGMAQVRWELEDLSFKYLEPADYKALAKLVTSKRGHREGLIAQMEGPLARDLKAAGIKEVEVVGRPKHLWSIWKKMKQRDKPYEEIYDLMAVRVLVNTVPECYHALGVIHDAYTPLQERIKDYIAQPKSNGYQSLHTTVFGPGRQLYEVQIRTREMHQTAEYGIAAHWLYKEERDPDQADQQMNWLRQILEFQLDAKNPAEFFEFLKLDLYQREIFVLTPTGDVVELPDGATPIDFAFAVHSEVGLHCQGAKVNGRIAPLSRVLKSSDTVEIITSPNARPSRDWLAHVRTGRARHRIRQWIRQEEQTTSARLGRDILEREVRRRGLAKPDDDSLKAAAKLLNLNDAHHLIASLGQGDVNKDQVIKALYPMLETPSEKPAQKPSAFERLVTRMRGAPKGVRIQGVDGLMVRYSQCCQPVPGDPVVGFVTRGRGVSIHRADCPNVLSLSSEPERRLDIDWQEVQGQIFLVRLALEGTDRRGLYADIAEAVTATGTNIKSVDLRSGDGGGVSGTMLVEVENLAHLQKVIRVVRKIKGITDIARRERHASEEQ